MWMWDDLLGPTGPGADVFSIEGLLELDLIFHLISISRYNSRVSGRLIVTFKGSSPGVYCGAM